MNNRAAARGAIGAVLLLGLGMYGCGREAPKLAADDAESPETHSLEEYAARAREVSRSDASTPQGAPRMVPVGVILSGDTTAVALSKDERRWLDSHQFLTQEEVDDARSIPDEVLKSARRDPRSLTIWGLRLLERGSVTSAASVLENAASQGSIYAYEQAAVAQLKQSMRENGGQVDTNAANAFRARMEVAKILGDHRADALFAMYVPDYDTQGGARTVQEQTTEFLRQLGEEAQLQGFSAAGPDPRPNADLWVKLQKLQEAGGASEPISVY